MGFIDEIVKHIFCTPFKYLVVYEVASIYGFYYLWGSWFTKHLNSKVLSTFQIQKKRINFKYGGVAWNISEGGGVVDPDNFAPDPDPVFKIPDPDPAWI